MRAGMVMLAVACLVLGRGVLRGAARLSAVASPLGGYLRTGPVLRAGLAAPDSRTASAQMSPAIVGSGLGLVVFWPGSPLSASPRAGRGCGWATRGAVGASSRRRGWSTPSTAFAEPLRRIFAEFYRPTEDVTVDFHPDSRYFVQSIVVSLGDPAVVRALPVRP